MQSFTTLGTVAQTAGRWQEVDWRVKYGWRLVPWVWMKTDWLFIVQWPGGVTGYLWLTAFTVWECGTCSDGPERETVGQTANWRW